MQTNTYLLQSVVVGLGKVARTKMRGWLPLALASMLMLSCEKDKPEIDINENEYTAIDEWILDNMETFYLWTKHLPTKTDITLPPDEYFETLIYERETIDRFSWIQDNFQELMQSLQGVTKEAGYDYSLLKWSDKSQSVVGCITYIKSGSPAEQAGLKRGDVFAAVNGRQLTLDNYSELMGLTGEPHTLGLIDLSKDATQEPEADRNVSLPVVVYAENPILLDTVYAINNVKAGYLVYNFFANDDGNGDIVYAKQLNNVFGKFASAGIGELIIDLRYNSGGALSTTEAMAAMISGKGSSDLLGSAEYNIYLAAALANQNGADYNKIKFPDYIYKYDGNGKPTEQVTINKLKSLNRVYFIVSGRSASASEMLINALRPYVQTTLIGTQTYGKNVGSITIYEEDPKKQETNKWGMQPIVVKYANSQGFSDYPAGFVPDIQLSEMSTLPLRPLGDMSEPLLNAALTSISGLTVRSADVAKPVLIIGSSLDKTPIRNNMYLDPRDARSRAIRSALQ